MFVGHYAVALAAKRFAPRTSLGWSFGAVQFLDILWALLILLGVERARLIPGYLPASPFYLYDMPWTHSLAMALIWSWFIYRASKVPALGICVFSHWVLDLVAHWHDLPLYRGGRLLLGFGLWRSAPATVITESLLLLLGLWMYMRATRARSKAGLYAVPIFVLVLILVGAANIYGPPPASLRFAAISAELAYIVFALIAAWLDRLRVPAEPVAAQI